MLDDDKRALSAECPALNPTSQTRRADGEAYSSESLRTFWCWKASEDLKNTGVEPNPAKLHPDETFFALEASNDSQGHAFWIARVTEPIATTDESFEGVDGAKFRKGDKHLCVQLLTRTPPSSTNVFTMSDQIVFVHVRSVFLSGVTPTRHVGDQTIVLNTSVVNRIHDSLLEFMHGNDVDTV